MPVIPSFSAFAPKPNLAGAYGAGVGALQEQQQLANEADRIILEAQQLRQNYELERRRLNLQAQTAMMENATKRELAAAEAAQDAQRLEIDKAYRTSMIGLQKAELDQRAKFETAKLEADAKEAADLFTKQQAYRQYADYLVENEGYSSEDAYREAALRYAPNFQGGGTMFSAALRPEKDTKQYSPEPIPAGEIGGVPFYREGENMPPKPVPNIPLSPSERTSVQATQDEINDLQQRATALEKEISTQKAQIFLQREAKASRGELELSDFDKAELARIHKAMDEAKKMRDRIILLQGKAVRPFGGGAPVQSGSTNRITIKGITQRGATNAPPANANF